MDSQDYLYLFSQLALINLNQKEREGQLIKAVVEYTTVVYMEHHNDNI